MDRRLFFKGLLGTTAATGVVLAAKPEQAHIRGGWDIRWAGWKSDVNCNHLFGLYLAVRKLPSGEQDHYWPMFYSSTPGLANSFLPGEQFHLGLQPDQLFITPHSSDQEKKAAQKQCLDALTVLLEKAAHVDWRRMRSITVEGDYNYDGVETIEQYLPVNFMRRYNAYSDWVWNKIINS